MSGFRSPLLVVTCLAALLATAAPSWAQTAPTASRTTQEMLRQLRAGTTLKDFLEGLRRQFAQNDADGDGRISSADIELHGAVAQAQARGFSMMQIMRADLDGDGTVTADEVRRMLRYEGRLSKPAGWHTVPGQPVVDPIETQVRAVMAADTDGDGRITLSEALNFATAQPGRNELMLAHGPAHFARQTMVFDADGDGVVTLAELESAGEALFRTVDTDGDDKISQEELATYRQRLDEPNVAARRAADQSARQREQARREAEEVRARDEAEKRAACAMPKASAAAKIVLLGAYETEALSSVALGSQDEVTQVGTIVVEPGTEPVYVVVANFRRTIWRFYGAVDRIERVVLAGTEKSAEGVPLVGATGIPADRLTFLRHAECVKDFRHSADAGKAADTVEREAGKAPDIIAAQETVGGFSVPSGKIERDPSKQPFLTVIHGDGETLLFHGSPPVTLPMSVAKAPENRLKRFRPGGVVQIDAKAVVSTSPVEPYEVLPQEAGLMQLVRSGALSQGKEGNFLIHKKIRLPAGLSGAHGVEFVLLRGVPEPDGDLRQSKILSQETGGELKRQLR
jgi:Ca2+-binding EF-hand superfamily protein